MEEYLTYEQFGAVGDGVTDDMPALCAAHAAANERRLPVKAKAGATYYIAPKAACAEVKTSVDWTGARFIIDDRGLDYIGLPVFRVTSWLEPIPLPLTSLSFGQTRVENPTGRELFVIVRNEHHRDYIRRGANQNQGTARQDCFLVGADGTLPSPVSFDFDEITFCMGYPLDEEPLVLRGGEFTTIANECESRYTYHGRNITVSRSHVSVEGITHLVTGEGDHGAPYSGFLSVSGCAKVTVDSCTFTGHKTYWTIGNAGTPVPMGSYDINCGCAAEVSFRHCRQTTDIMDRAYWGVIGTNFCRDLSFEDCVFSRFDAHQGVTNCTIRNCRLGHQCLNAIGYGTFVIEDTEAFGYAFVNLRDDYGCTWRGRMVIRGCTWHPAGAGRSVFRANNDGTHDFGYDCYLPTEVELDGFTLAAEEGNGTLYLFNDWTGKLQGEVKYPMIPPKSVRVKNVRGAGDVRLCENDSLLEGTEFSAE